MQKACKAIYDKYLFLLQQKQLQQQNATSSTIQSSTLPRPNTANSLHVAASKQQITAHQHTASWSYYPTLDSAQLKSATATATAAAQTTAMAAVVDPHGNYYHIPAQARHSYHGHEAIYQNCQSIATTTTVQPNNAHVAMPVAVPLAQHHQHMQHQQQYGKFARSPTRRPESPPPLRNYHQTMVLIPYNAETYEQYTAQEQENYRRQHNIVEYQQVNGCGY